MGATSLVLFSVILLSTGLFFAAAASPTVRTVTCDDDTIASKLLDEDCTGDTPSESCCEGALAAVEMPGCFCFVIENPSFEESNLTTKSVISMYTMCRGSPPPFDPTKSCAAPFVPAPPTSPLPPASPIPSRPETPSSASAKPSTTSLSEKVVEGFVGVSCTIGFGLLCIGLAWLINKYKPYLLQWCPAPFLDCITNGLNRQANKHLRSVEVKELKEVVHKNSELLTMVGTILKKPAETETYAEKASHETLKKASSTTEKKASKTEKKASEVEEIESAGSEEGFEGSESEV